MPAKRQAKPAGTPAKKPPRKASGPDPKLLLKLYREMLLIRRFEERAGQLYGMGMIGGFCHLYIGQEAVVTGMMSAGTEGDSIVASYRCHGHMLACGMDPKGVMAELTGRAAGYSKGKGGSMHMFSTEKHFYGGHGIVGAQVPIATGLGFAHKHKKDGLVAICYLGDGAVNQGQVYESLNMAALWKLPVLYVIENNKYGMGTSQERASAGELHDRGEGYGIPGKAVDGMDVLTVRDAAAEALKYVRDDNGPMILEMMTYRYRGHSMSDPAKYRTREEVDEMRKGHDPIDHLGAKIVEAGAATEEQLKDIDREIRARVAEAAEFATSAPEPEAAELWTDILVDA
jgi:pyruvate dehydrogenase E1 component alpha subunit